MTSARTCYCKQEGCALREEDNDIEARSENRRPVTVVSRKSIVKSGSSGGSPRTARSVVDERKPDTSRSIEARARDPVLSPETSIALENAERIINDAKIRLAEVRVVPNFDSARHDRDTYTDDLPLDDEVEELLYIRELVTSKFQETTYPGRTEAGDEEDAPRVTARRVDLSASKFRTSQRRRATVCASLECGTDEQRSQERAPLAGTLKDSSSLDDEVTTRDSQTARRRVSSARVGLVCPDDGGVCRIQIGPPVHISRELTRQDLEDVHISPGPSPAYGRVNVATYVLRHESVTEGSSASVDNETNEPLMTSRARRRARLATSSKEKCEELIAAEAAVERATTNASRKLQEDIRVAAGNKDSDYERKDEQPSTSYLQNRAYGEEKRGEEADLRDAENMRILERPMTSIMNEKTTDTVRKSEPVCVNRAEANSGNDVGSRLTGDAGIFNKKSDADSPGRPQNEEHVADKVQAKNRGNQSQLPLAPTDVSRRASFPRCENIARPCRTTASLRQYRTIDEYLADTSHRHDGSDEPCDVVTEEKIRRSRLSWGDFPAEDDANEVELYRPRLDELDSILLSNDKKIERAVHAAQTFAKLLSKPEFAEYKSEGRRREISRDNPSTADLSGDHGCRNPLVLDKPTMSLPVVATTSKHQTPSVSSASEMRGASDADSRETSAAATETKSSSFTRRNIRHRDGRSQNSPESIERPTSGVSDGSRMSPDGDGVQQPKSKARLSESSMDKSDITTFSNLPPALSSTRTDTQTYHPRQEQNRIARAKPEASENRYANSKPRVTNHLEDSATKTGRQMRESYDFDDVFTQILQSLRDETTDQFVAYILQDERRSIKVKFAKALDDSAVAPTMMEKLLARLQETDSVGDRTTRRAESLNVLKDILINIKSRADGVVDDGATKDEEETKKMNSRNISPRAIGESISYEENGRQTRTRITSNENGQLMEHSRNLGSRDERSESRGSATHTIPDSQGNEGKKNSYSEGESLKRISDILSDESGNPRANSRLSSVKVVSMKSRKDHETEADDLHSATTMFQDEKDNTSDKGREYKSGEVKDDKDLALGDQHTNENIPRTTTSRVNDTLLDVPGGTLIIEERKEEEEKAEIVDEKIANDSTASKDEQVSSLASGASKKKNKSAKSDASSDRSRAVDEVSAKKDLAHSLTEKNIRSSRVQVEKDTDDPRTDAAVAANGKISPENSCSADSLRDCASLRTLSSAQSDELPFKETQSRGERASLDIVGEDNWTKVSNEGDGDHSEPMTNGTLKDHGNGNEESALPKSAGNDGNEQFRPVALTLRKSLSSSSTSVSSTTDHNNGSNNGAFGDDTKRTGTSPEVSHSEGELYMPSSCSYSLGEVRILEKSDLIADSTIERDSSVTILVTRSMLTSLNNSSTPLGSSGRIY